MPRRAYFNSKDHRLLYLCGPMKPVSIRYCTSGRYPTTVNSCDGGAMLIPVICIGLSFLLESRGRSQAFSCAKRGGLEVISNFAHRKYVFFFAAEFGDKKIALVNNVKY